MPLMEWIPDAGFLHPKILIYGASGAGKTVFGSTAPKPVFADAENGMASIKREGVGRWPIRKVEDIGGLLTFLETENHPITGYQTLVIDSLNEIQRLLNDYVLNMDGVGKRPYGGAQMTQGDWGISLNMFENRLIRRILNLQMNVICLAGTSGAPSPEGKIEPALYGKNTVTMVTRYMDVVGYMQTRSKRNAEGQDLGTDHVLSFHVARAVTKDRSGVLPVEIVNATWDDLVRCWYPDGIPSIDTTLYSLQEKETVAS